MSAAGRATTPPTHVSRLNGFDARFSGELFQLPAGAVQPGASIETRRETIPMENDRNDQTGGWLPATPTNPFSAEQTVDIDERNIVGRLRCPNPGVWTVIDDG